MLWIKEVEMVAKVMELPRHAINRRRRTSREDPNDGHKEDALPAHHHSCAGGAMLFNHLKYSEFVRIGTREFHIPDGGLRCVTWNTRRLIGSTFSSAISQ